MAVQKGSGVMTEAEQLAAVIREMRPSELMSQRLVDRIQRVIDEAIEEGRSTRAILEVQGRKRFLEDLRKEQRA